MLARTRDIVTYRDLLRNLVVRDLKVRYRGSFIGFLWSLLNPVLMMAVYWFVFTQLLKSNKAQFHLFVFVALLPWNWCAASVMGGIASIVGNGHLIKKVYFPRELLPLSVVISNGINFLFAMPVLFLLIAVTGTGADLRKMEGHTRPVAAVAVAPGNSGVMASGSEDHSARLWQMADGAPLATLATGTAPVSTLAFAPDGGMLATAGEDHHIRLWRRADGVLLRTLEDVGATVASVAFAPDGQTLAAGLLDGTVHRWHAPAWDASPPIKAGRAVWSVAFTPDSQILASGGDDRVVRLWRLADAQLLRTLDGPTRPVVSVAVAPDGATVAAGATDGTVRFWHTADGSPVRTLTGTGGTVYGLAFAPGGDTLVTGSEDHNVRLWRVADG
ncbi:MAG TPA: ABC transporter permease, partial [Chloroflexia bacterium]|nr:ABC transporter permease [Chloroflexia bacterium]